MKSDTKNKAADGYTTTNQLRLAFQGILVLETSDERATFDVIEILAQAYWISQLKEQYPTLEYFTEGEIKNPITTPSPIMRAPVLSLFWGGSNFFF